MFIRVGGDAFLNSFLIFMIFQLMFIYGGYTSTFRVCLIRRCGFYFESIPRAAPLKADQVVYVQLQLGQQSIS